MDAVCVVRGVFGFFNDTATTEIYTLSLHDALPIFDRAPDRRDRRHRRGHRDGRRPRAAERAVELPADERSEEQTSELQSRQYIVCGLLLEKKNPAPAPRLHYVLDDWLAVAHSKFAE